MAIDSSVGPEFQFKLDWMDRFVTEEVEPLDLYFRDTVSPFDRTDASANL
jgi:acyl-CoA dehydrogenase